MPSAILLPVSSLKLLRLFGAMYRVVSVPVYTDILRFTRSAEDASRSPTGGLFGTDNRRLSNIEMIYDNRRAIATDHSYPRPRAPDDLTPLMTSLHLTITHIQRQAGLLRRQVESIDRIDRAMLEVPMTPQF